MPFFFFWTGLGRSSLPLIVIVAEHWQCMARVRLRLFFFFLSFFELEKKKGRKRESGAANHHQHCCYRESHREQDTIINPAKKKRKPILFIGIIITDTHKRFNTNGKTLFFFRLFQVCELRGFCSAPRPPRLGHSSRPATTSTRPSAH